MVLGVDICLSTINAWRVIGYLLYIVRILVPLLIIIIATKSFFNVIVKGNLDETKKSFMNLLSKIVIGIIIFMIPSLINTLIVLLSGINFGEGFSMCSICMDSPGGLLCNSYIDKYEQMMNEQINLSDDVKVDGSVDGLDSINKDGMYDSQNTNSNIKGTKNIIIGDSRTVGMCAAMTGSYTGCIYSDSGKKYGSDIYIAKGSMGYAWFDSTAVGAVDDLISNNSDTTYNIFSLMGVNYLLSDIDSYISKYNSLASGRWKNHRIILVSVNPVNEYLESSHGYTTKNVNIEKYNTKLKNNVKGNNITYCDTYNYIKDNFSTGDGLHYSGNTYKKIYNYMMNCI